MCFTQKTSENQCERFELALHNPDVLRQAWRTKVLKEKGLAPS